VFVPIINPILKPVTQDSFMFEEECFSFYSMRAKVERFKSVEVTYLDENQQSHTQVMSGEFAGLIQHEIDHLDGIFFVDKVEDKKSVVSIDYLYKDDPKKLSTVKKLCDYMAS
jgi:peptide deformylase